MRKLIKYLLPFIIVFQSNFSYGESNNSIDWYNKELIINGQYVRVLLVVEKEFISHITEKANEIKKKGIKYDVESSTYLSKIENYNIEIGVGKGKFAVWISPRLSEEFPGFFGGDAFYAVDSKTFKILDTQYGK
ncbi:hypothetical protein [Methylovulum miyakonense]|uniref:hypothetical protein n=1 Tax=Methylovulum miyakonense TaxID=645578 RepID=UPI00037A6581|nr:hypothetical protein [Methylovulum miyakonense]